MGFYRHLTHTLRRHAVTLLCVSSGGLALSGVIFSGTLGMIYLRGMLTLLILACLNFGQSELHRSWQRWLLELISGLVLVATWSQNTLQPAGLVAYTIYLSLITVGIIRRLITQHQVNREMLAAGIAGYLLLGVCGFFAALSLQALDPHAFHLGGQPLPRLGDDKLLYYSFVTLSTLGYGDILPTNALARTLTILLTTLGQIYTTLVLGLLLARYLRER